MSENDEKKSLTTKKIFRISSLPKWYSRPAHGYTWIYGVGLSRKKKPPRKENWDFGGQTDRRNRGEIFLADMPRCPHPKSGSTRPEKDVAAGVFDSTIDNVYAEKSSGDAALAASLTTDWAIENALIKGASK